MADLVHGGAAQVVAGHGAARHATREDVAAIGGILVRRDRRHGEGGGRGRGREQRPRRSRAGANRARRRRAQRGWQRTVPEQQHAHVAGRRGRRAQVGLEVDVEGRVGAVPERQFHRAGVGVGGPRISNRVGWSEVAERNVGGRVRSVKNRGLEPPGAGEGWLDILVQTCFR